MRTPSSRGKPETTKVGFTATFSWRCSHLFIFDKRSVMAVPPFNTKRSLTCWKQEKRPSLELNVNKQQQKNLIHFCEGELCSCASYKNGKKGKSKKNLNSRQLSGQDFAWEGKISASAFLVVEKVGWLRTIHLVMSDDRMSAQPHKLSMHTINSSLFRAFGTATLILFK